jgi:hypothetical protein
VFFVKSYVRISRKRISPRDSLYCEIRTGRVYVHEPDSATIDLRFHAILVLFVLKHEFFRRDIGDLFFNNGFDLLGMIERASRVSMTFLTFFDRD